MLRDAEQLPVRDRAQEDPVASVCGIGFMPIPDVLSVGGRVLSTGFSPFGRKGTFGKAT